MKRILFSMLILLLGLNVVKAQNSSVSSPESSQEIYKYEGTIIANSIYPLSLLSLDQSSVLNSTFSYTLASFPKKPFKTGKISCWLKRDNFSESLNGNYVEGKRDGVWKYVMLNENTNDRSSAVIEGMYNKSKRVGKWNISSTYDEKASDQTNKMVRGDALMAMFYPDLAPLYADKYGLQDLRHIIAIELNYNEEGTPHGKCTLSHIVKNTKDSGREEVSLTGRFSNGRPLGNWTIETKGYNSIDGILYYHFQYSMKVMYNLANNKSSIEALSVYKPITMESESIDINSTISSYVETIVKAVSVPFFKLELPQDNEDLPKEWMGFN